MYLNDIFPSVKIPIWLMRQAGRYLPEYRDTRATAKSFLDLCYSPDLVSKITLQPIDRFNFDAAIIFSDILVIPDALGVKVKFVEKQGPILDKITKFIDLNIPTNERFTKFLENVYLGIKKTKDILPKNKKLIGFIGAPWTLSTYLIEGQSSKTFSEVKKIAYTDPVEFNKIIEILAEFCILHTTNQIKAGVDIIQIFDSWSGILDSYNFNKWVISPTAYIVSRIKEKYPQIPIIGFPKDADFNYLEYVQNTKVDILSIDSNIPITWVNENVKDIIIQGNLDPCYLLSKDQELLKKQINNILDNLKHREHIFNLGHGILPNTPIENVELLIEQVRNYEK